MKRREKRSRAVSPAGRLQLVESAAVAGGCRVDAVVRVVVTQVAVATSRVVHHMRRNLLVAFTTNPVGIEHNGRSGAENSHHDDGVAIGSTQNVSCLDGCSCGELHVMSMTKSCKSSKTSNTDLIWN